MLQSEPEKKKTIERERQFYLENLEKNNRILKEKFNSMTILRDKLVTYIESCLTNDENINYFCHQKNDEYQSNCASTYFDLSYDSLNEDSTSQIQNDQCSYEISNDELEILDQIIQKNSMFSNDLNESNQLENSFDISSANFGSGNSSFLFDQMSIKPNQQSFNEKNLPRFSDQDTEPLIGWTF